MKTCPKCGYDKLADTARFCHKCGCDCAAVQVKRTPAAEEPEAAPLVGDKNLINESTIIGKQEKYEASNITIHNNITEDHSHTTIVCAVSGKRIYLDHSVVCPKCGKQVALEYYVEASKRCENCEQQAREEYRAFVVRTTGAGPLDAACKQQLDAEAQRLQIDAATQASILRARQQKPAGKSAELTSVQRAELEAAVSRLITATEPEPAQKSLEALTVLHENSSNYEAGYWYFLARAVVCPEESVKAYEEELTDDYWQRYWGFLGYCNTGSPKGGAAVDRLRSVFGQREDDIRLAEAIYYLARGFDAFETSMLGRAGELASSVRREYLSKPSTIPCSGLSAKISGWRRNTPRWRLLSSWMFSVPGSISNTFVPSRRARSRKPVRPRRGANRRHARPRRSWSANARPPSRPSAGSRPSCRPTAPNAWSRRWRAWAVRNPRRRNRRIRKPLRATRRSCRGRRSGTGERRS